jgi:hypothetical protein
MFPVPVFEVASAWDMQQKGAPAKLVLTPSGAGIYRSTELSPGQQAERIVAINDRLQLDTHDAERIADDALAALLTTA